MVEKDPNYTTSAINPPSFFLSDARICTVKVSLKKVCITVKHQKTRCVQYREYRLDSNDRQSLMYLREECNRVAATKFKAIRDRELAHSETEKLYGKAVYRYIQSIPSSGTLF